MREKSNNRYTVGNAVLPFNPLTYTEVSFYHTKLTVMYMPVYVQCSMIYVNKIWRQSIMEDNCYFFLHKTVISKLSLVSKLN